MWKMKLSIVTTHIVLSSLASILTTLIYYIPIKLCIRKLVAEDVKDHDITCKIRKRMIEQGPRQLL